MAQVGYARVSSGGQDLSVQLAALKEAGCVKVFAEKKSGRKASDREALGEALEWVRAGDTLIVTRLDRLARSIIDLRQIIDQLEAKGVAFRCLQQGAIDTSRSDGRLLLNILASFAEFEADIRAERQRDGIEAAKAKGVYTGRKPSVDAEAIKRALADGERPADVARRLGCARSTVYRLSA